MPRFRGRVIALLAVVGMAGGLTLATSGIALGNGASTVVGVVPNHVNELDCNGFSNVYKSVKPDLGGLCTDPLTPPGTWSTQASRFYDNGHYIGHDEPSVKFISNQPGSGSDMTYLMRVATDPNGTPTAFPGPNNTTDYAELSPAPWFGLPICDPLSYPLNPCTPQSDSNSGAIGNPKSAGSAFMELQFYPPGFTPFADAPSCDQTHWCVALTIDSLEAAFNFSPINLACEEPVNFAYLQTNGIPAGPPSPQLADASTYVPNANTLMINGGDVLKVTIKDVWVPATTVSVGGGTYSVAAGYALQTSVTDLTTGQTGTMTASAANGFMDTEGIVNGAVNPTCNGEPFNFAAEYSTASQANQVPWAALEGGVLMEDELGHFQACSSVSNPFPQSNADLTDNSVYQVCNGGSEGPGFQSHEQGCSLVTGNCPGATTQGGLACPPPPGGSQPNFTEGLSCEYSDALCMPKGPRQVTINGVTSVADWPVAGCQDDVFQNGDLDFDGTSYQPDWPNGQPNHPTSFEYLGPFANGTTPYPQVQFETDVLASEAFCNVATGLGCSVPPVGANFYPFWSLGRGSLSACMGGGDGQGAQGCRNGQDGQAMALGNQAMHGSSCLWNFGNVIPGTTVNTFGQSAEYGSADLLRYGGTATSAVMPNPQFAGGCGQNGR
ncbi:MAG: hypothetical protein M0027_11865 [Candidatus Dormibacteraeota bacterium]|nr:hypothetical protein [Candidatus Dormibacteraeota bacterium]